MLTDTGSRVLELKYDLKDLDTSQFRTVKSPNPKSKETYQQVDMRVEVSVSKDVARVQLVLGKERAFSSSPLDIAIVPLTSSGTMSGTIQSPV